MSLPLRSALPFALAACTGAFACLGSTPVRAQTSDVSWGLFPFLEGNWDSQVGNIITDAVGRGIDTLYVSVFRATDPLTGNLWITDNAGTWNPAWGTVRPTGAGINLVSLISAAHAQNINVVGVLRCFDEDVQPDSIAHKNYLLDVIDYLVRSHDAAGNPVYDLDGLALDYIRYVGGGGSTDDTQVTDFVRQIREHVGTLSLHAYLIANRFSFDGPVYNLNFNSYAATMNTLRNDFGQNWEDLSEYLDVLMPMTYTADGSIYSSYAEHFAFCQQAAAYATTAKQLGGYPGRRVTPVVRTYGGSGETTTATTIDASIDGALAGGAAGYQSFRYGTMRFNSSWSNAFSAQALPGANWPVARADVTVTGFTVSIDTSVSTDSEDASSALEMQLDLDDDGVADTPWQPVGVYEAFMPQSGRARIGIAIRDTDGHVARTVRYPDVGGQTFDVGPLVYPSAFGGPLAMTVNAGPGAAGSLYLALTTLSGASPGFTLEGLQVPINFDGWTDGLLNLLNTPVLQNGLGFLDASGRATITFSVPAGLLGPIALNTMTWAVIGADPMTGDALFVTNPDSALILP